MGWLYSFMLLPPQSSTTCLYIKRWHWLLAHLSRQILYLYFFFFFQLGVGCRGLQVQVFLTAGKEKACSSRWGRWCNLNASFSLLLYPRIANCSIHGWFEWLVRLSAISALQLFCLLAGTSGTQTLQTVIITLL